ncbi:hypothetical protein [Pedobacter roseus]|uniref:Ig-like domain-containing protein n=1 Tax=Pedobacter roseus TaxID=336820 RepID=A0A7G9QIC5_9SPHI|nr:hypothetical protein [Pedobacter roseus]QNN43100.1 hypothetical protein H9L23_03055 [Pedobacter roseus]
MNSTIKKSLFVIALLLICNFLRVSAQITPTTTGVNLFCKGSDLTLPAPPAGSNWIVRFSASSTTTPSTVITLVSGNQIAAANLQNGYYYLSSKSTTAGSCESDMQEIPVYVLKPLVPDFAAANFCVETPIAQLGSITNPEDPTITTLAYQWYTVVGSTETAITGATQKDYTPVSPTVGITKYRLKVGYVINGNKYCAQTVDHDVTVTAKPTKPTITPAQISGTASAVTF